MTNFYSCLKEYQSRGRSLIEDEGFCLPPKQSMRIEDEHDKKIADFFEGKYTKMEEITTYRNFEYQAIVNPIGISPKELKRKLKKVLRAGKINATVSVKAEDGNLHLTILVQ